MVGGGPAGLTAALMAARQGASVLLLERMAQPGLKLRLTGKGRCNLTNMAPMAEFLQHIGPDARFLRNAFGRFFNRDLCAFVEQLGVPLQEERGKRVFPVSGKSTDVFLALVRALEAMPNAEIRRNARVGELLLESDGQAPALRGVRLADGTELLSRSVVLCTGGVTYPSTGSTGDGYRLAAQAGHSIVEPVAALSPLICAEPVVHDMVDFMLKNVSLRLDDEQGRKLFEQFGELSFTADGMAGPIVLAASRAAARRLHEGGRLTASIDLKPALTAEQLDRRLIADLNENGKRLWYDALRLWLPAELTDEACRRLKVPKYKRLHQVDASERRRLLNLLKGWHYTVTGCHGPEESLVTQGGVATNEVNPKTMESRLLPGLYIAGELLNLDADTGGYNLQIAFSTGYAAGLGIASQKIR